MSNRDYTSTTTPIPSGSVPAGKTFQEQRAAARAGLLGDRNRQGSTVAGMDAAGGKARPPVFDTMVDQRPIALPFPPPYPQGGPPNASR